MQKPVWFALLAFVASAALAQVRESVTVEVVEVPVYVSTGDGTPIRGLTKNDFELFINGKRQIIDYFDPFDIAVPAESAAPRQQRERRLYLLLFDKAYSMPARIARAQRAAEAALEQSNTATDFFSVATYTPTKGIQFATPFLSDRAAIRRAIKTLSMGREHDPLGVAISERERSAWGESGAGTVAASRNYDAFSSANAANELAGWSVTNGPVVVVAGGVNTNAALADAEMADALAGGAANQEAIRQPDAATIDNQIANLAEVAARLASLEGQKHVLLFSEGFESRTMHRGGSFSLREAGPDTRLFARFEEMTRVFRAAGVFLDTIDIVGTRTSLNPAHAVDVFANDSLQFLAHETGGAFVHNQNDLTAALTNLTESQQVVYLLGFHRRDNRGGDISVRVHNVPRGARVSYRQGFGGPRRGTSIDSLQLADILINDIPQNGITLTTQVTVEPGAADLTVGFSRAEVMPQLSEKSPYIDALFYVFDEEGATVAFKPVRISFTASQETDGMVPIHEHIALPPGRYVAKVLFRIAGTTSLGYERREIVIK